MAESAEDDPGPAFALRPGTVIGQYAIRRVLGQGGFGITYAAEHRVIGRRVAIKELYPVGRVHRADTGALIYSKAEAPTVAWALDKFEATTKTLCTLDHPNIVRVFDYLKANETGYMIMELLDGATLEHWLRQRSDPPSVGDLMPLVEPVMDALAYVHGQGLIHRDVAPDNILITDKGRPVLIDFGSVSRDLSDSGPQTRSGTTGQSKRNYTAPEQIRAKAKPTPEADVYSMGAVLYRALAGTAPEDGLDRVLGNGPEPHEPLTSRCPPGCSMPAAQAVDRALALRPEDRFHAMVQLRDGMKGQAPSPPPPEPVAAVASSRRTRGPALAATLAYGAGGLVAGALIGHAIGAIVTAAIAVGLHRLYVYASAAKGGSSKSDSRGAPVETGTAASMPPAPLADATPELAAPEPWKRRVGYPLVAEAVIGLAVFVLARLATQSPIAALVAAVGAVLVFRLAVVENGRLVGEAGAAGAGAALDHKGKVRVHGRNLLVAGAIGVALVPVNALFSGERKAYQAPAVIQPVTDDTSASGNGSAADDSAADDDTVKPATPHRRSCRHAKHGCRK